MKVVVVESPAKAKTINKYLGSDYKVLASFGHIRDLPPKDGSVRPDEDFAMDWEVDGKSAKHVKEITDALKGAERLYLATDPDREGEAISWHVQEVLGQKKALKNVDVKRITFNAITKSAVQEALRAPRDLDRPLIEAYLARRALDYLVGFNLSPVLWRKLPGAKSAGRVQSVALRLICERESEIERFVAEEYWTVQAEMTAADKPFTARLTHLDGNKLDKFDLNSEALAHAAADRIQAATFTVDSVESKRVRRNPYPPFTTSTLQQEAARKLHFSARQTMQTAQRLYEGVDIGGETVGLITYMRTDGVQMAPEAISAVRDRIAQEFGPHFVPQAPREYKTKAKNAQEAHEAIRPTDVSRSPKDMAKYLERDQLRLYELIWKRTVASQMESAQLDQVAVDLVDGAREITLRATGSVVAFDGFLKLYTEDKDDEDDENGNGSKRLPKMNMGDRPKLGAVTPEQHFTQPPPRYSEASLVRKLEELGIGRPSTYASIISVLQDRDYVKLDKRRFVPEDRGRVVTAFLQNFFPRYVQYNFTADLEQTLDDISAGQADWKDTLQAFWTDFQAAIDKTKGLKISDVIDALDEDLGRHFFPVPEDGSDPRLCPKCNSGRLGLRLGKFGAFIGCSNYPECDFTKPLSLGQGGAADGEAASPATDHRVLGTDPKTGHEVTVRKGPYGHYIQLGEPEGEGKKKTKPPRVSVPKGYDPATVDLDTGLALLALPRDVGPHNESGEMITAGIGRYGPYLKHQNAYKSLPPGDDVLTIGLNRAMELLANVKPKLPAKEIGPHPSDEKPITWHSGRFGPYVQHGKIRATIPRKHPDPENVTLAEAIELIDAKAAKDGGGAKAKKAPAKKAPAKKKAAPKKKAPAKKT